MALGRCRLSAALRHRGEPTAHRHTPDDRADSPKHCKKGRKLKKGKCVKKKRKK